MTAPNQSSSSNVYASDPNPATIRTHQWRTVSNSAPHIIPFLQPGKGVKILDIGCGPGTITIDIGRRVAPDGHVTGVEYESVPLESAREQLAQVQADARRDGGAIPNVDFVQGDALNLKDFADDTFDLVHAHQVLQHVPDPVQALREMRRVAKSDGGIVACRESASMLWYPKMEVLDAWYEGYLRLGRAMGGNPDPGSYIHVWAQTAGFPREKINCSAAAWCFSDEADRAYWSKVWAQRSISPNHIANATKHGICREEDLKRISKGLEEWGNSKDGWFLISHGQLICHK